jgi:hypothetical protein
MRLTHLRDDGFSFDFWGVELLALPELQPSPLSRRSSRRSLHMHVVQSHLGSHHVHILHSRIVRKPLDAFAGRCRGRRRSRVCVWIKFRHTEKNQRIESWMGVVAL